MASTIPTIPKAVTTVLIVCDRADDPAQQAIERLKDGAANILRVDNVYAAMALLGADAAIAQVLVDVRDLDAQELAFLQLAPRYHPGRPVMPLIQDVAAPHAGHDEIVEPPTRIKAVAADRPSDAPEAPRPPAKLSTDGGRVEPAGPSLHEAVRRKMAADDPRTIRRQPPPRRAPPAPKPPSEEAGP